MEYKNITVINSKALELMQNFELDIKHHDNLSRVKQPDIWHENQYDEVAMMSTSPEYLDRIINNQVTYQKYSFNQTFGETHSASAFLSGTKTLLDWDRYYTSAYVPKGFVSWHHDRDVAGWFLMFTYSPYQNGYFRWRDPDTGSIHTDSDSDRWIVRQGRMYSEPDRYFWHCCQAIDDRWTMILCFDSINKYQRATAILTSN